MPTLRELARQDRPNFALVVPQPNYERWFDTGIAHALRDYGDYEIVEGELRIDNAGRIWTGLFNLPVTVGHQPIGKTGNHVKLLVPPWKQPERKQQPSEREKRLNTVLQQIVDIAAEAELQSYLVYGEPNPLNRIAQHARRALEEKDE